MAGTSGGREAAMTERRDSAPPASLGPGRGIRVEQEIVVRRTPAELFRLWRDLSTMGRVFRHVERVDCVSSHRSHWVVRGPLGTTLEWDAEIINEVENELIGWQSLPGADVDCAGSVHFERHGEDGARGLLAQRLRAVHRVGDARHGVGRNSCMFCDGLVRPAVLAQREDVLPYRLDRDLRERTRRADLRVVRLAQSPVENLGLAAGPRAHVLYHKSSPHPIVA